MNALRLLLAFCLAFASLASPAIARAAGSPIYIGLDAEFGIPNSTSDDAIRMGILTAIDEINASGGLLGGRPLELVTRDNKSVPARGKDNFTELAGMTDMVAVFCSKFSPVCLEQAPLANRLRIPLLNPWGAADEIVPTEPAGSYVFRLSLRDSWAVPAMLSHLSARGIDRIGVLLPPSAWGRSSEANINSYVKKAGKPQVAGVHWYNWGATSFRDEYAKLRASGARAILLVGNEPEGAVLVREIAEMPKAERLPVVSHWGITGGRFVELTGPSIREVDLAVVQTFTLNGRDDAKARQVVSRALRLFDLKSADDIPSQVGFGHAYDLTHILARAITLAKSTDRPAVRDALERVRDVDGLVTRYARPFSPESHEALNPKLLFMGRFTEGGSVARAKR